MGDVQTPYGLKFYKDETVDVYVSQFVPRDCPLLRQLLLRLRYDPFPNGITKHKVADESDPFDVSALPNMLAGNFLTQEYDEISDTLYTVLYFVDRRALMVVVTLIQTE